MSLASATGIETSRRRPIDALTDAFRPVYARLFDETDSFVVNLQDKLAEARIDQTVEVYLSRALAFGTICGIVLWLVGTVVSIALIQTGLVEIGSLTNVTVPNETLLALIEAGRIPFLILSSGIVLGTLGFGAVFGGFVAIPYARAGQRKREIDALLPDAVSFMYALSIGGMSQIEIIETMAEAEDTYGEVSMEFRTILYETRYFDTDYRTAIQKRAVQTPSTELSQFLTDMLSIIDSGGSMTDFLDDKKDIHFRHAKEGQEQTLETLELFTEMYITISLFPLLLIVILVILDMIGGVQELLLYATVYALIPGLGIAFLVLVSTVRPDQYGNGYLELDANVSQFDLGQQDSGALDLGLIEQFTGSHYIFDRIERREGTNVAKTVLKNPHVFLRDNPHYTLVITVPASIAFILTAVLTDSVAVGVSGFIDQPVWSTIVYVYVPIFFTCIPFAVFWEWNRRRRYAVLNGLSENLRKLASANATGLTLLESIKVVADTTPGKLGEEFETIHSKSNYGMHLKESLVVFNNTYHIPRLARTVKLITKAQEISSQISTVLSTAARATETQEDIERDRKQRAMMQVSIIIVTFLTLLGVMALLKAQFIDVMAEVAQQTGSASAGGQDFGATMDLNVLSLLFFHAVTLQAILSGLICGSIRDADMASGAKYVVVLLLAALGTWMVVA